MTTTNAASVSSAPVLTATVPATTREKRKALSASLGKLAVEVTGVSRDATDKHLAMLRDGKSVLRGKEHTLTLIETARLILKVMKRVGAVGVPVEVQTRFTWGAMNRDTLAEVATSAGIEPALFLTALGITPAGQLPPEAEVAIAAEENAVSLAALDAENDEDESEEVVEAAVTPPPARAAGGRRGR